MPSDSESDDDFYGPALPPGFKKASDDSGAVGKTEIGTKGSKAENVQIGPVLPPEYRNKLEANASTATNEADGEAGLHTEGFGVASLDQSGDNASDSESDSEIIGPLPPDHPDAQKRNLSATLPSSSDNKKLKREEWMLVPPKNKIIPGLGLGPRKFLTRAPEDSRNSDEEEDEDEAFAREAEAAIERKLVDEYDQKQEEIKKDFETKKRRGESLMEIHQKEMKKKKGESKEKAERKPFDRDTDLQISGLSKEDKDKYIKKSKELDSKFSRGSRKYL